jgi:serine protease inhibitor
VFRNASLGDVNDWVAHKTKGKIDKILDERDAQGANAVILSAVISNRAGPHPSMKSRLRAKHFTPPPRNKSKSQ